jgi:hypothetical protein
VRGVSDKKGRDNHNVYLMFSNSPPLPENLAVYEIIWKNIVETERPQMTI